MEAQPVHVKIAGATAAALFLAAAAGLLGVWALAVGVSLLVATAVATAIAWEEQEAATRSATAQPQVPRGR
jgi:hypothetical protein